MATVTYEAVTKRFGDVEAVSDLSLEVLDGEFLVLVGPSGSGKSTALRLLAGLESLSEGHLRIGDRVVDDVPPRDRDIAMVFQDYALYPQMTVRRNLAFGLRMRKLPGAEIESRVTRTAGMLGIEHLLERKPRELSGGQRQRVALGRALVREPAVFLMDEPLSNLDAQLRTQTRGEIKRLQRAVGTTTVYVTHDQVEAMTMGDRIVVMRDGRIEQVGSPHDVYDDPANAFVAGFIGSPAMSFARFTTESEDGALVLRRGEASLRLPAREVPAEVLLGVRPEHAGAWRDGGGLIGPVEGTVRFVEDLGRQRLVAVEIAEDATYVLEMEGSERVDLDDHIRIGFEPDRIHLFDPTTGAALGRP